MPSEDSEKKRKEKNENPLGTLDIWRWQYPSSELLSCFSCSPHDTVSNSRHCSFWSFRLIVAPVTDDLKHQRWSPVPRTFVSWSWKTWFYLSLFSSFTSTSLRFFFFLIWNGDIGYSLIGFLWELTEIIRKKYFVNSNS